MRRTPAVVEAVDETEVVEQVDAYTRNRTIRSIDPEGNEIVLGHVRSRDFDSDRSVRGLWFDSAQSGRLHPLGATTASFQVFDHLEVVKPIMEAGFKPQIVQHARGGASFMGFFSHPDLEFEDPIHWDQFATKKKGTLQAAVRVRSDLRKGHGLSMDIGYFRLLCLNGMVSRAFDFGTLRTAHTNWGSNIVESFLTENPLPKPQEFARVPSSLLANLPEYLTTSAEEIASMPRLLREPIQHLREYYSPVVNRSLATEIEVLAEKQDSFSKFDLLNALTNQARVARTTWSVYDEADSAMGKMVQIVELEALKVGTDAF